ncbi:MAG: histidinol-phosphatase [Candidatus Carbobacillus altaicus]|uniref:Histidinol-phosphatase n=1 Tax=Candidatus Carbonibacillus altaicus TaxID=2163959 RepID=A0A2R6Y4A7_9BACL|nr:histidinol-phosphatase [Candidatus Carbobacillus altaicus]PTQ57516.1 MAG: Histidinol-phosphatase [Candidatus Carbobacillus altaicus]
MRTDYHVHLQESRGLTLDWLKVYVETAQEKGIDELGISEHAYFFDETAGILTHPWAEARRTLRFADYMKLYEEARGQGMNVKLGIEMDYIPGKEKFIRQFIERYPFDYVIGSVHWVGEFGIDLLIYREEYKKWDLKKLYRAYFDQVIQLAQSGLFQFVGHIDLIKIFGYRPDDEAFLDALYNEVVEVLAKTGTIIELSTAGWRKPVEEQYPSRAFLEKCFAAGVGIVLSSDAHTPEHLGYRYDDAVRLAWDIGYREVHVLEKRKATPVPLT